MWLGTWCRRPTAVVALACAMALGASGCGGDDKGGSGADGSGKGAGVLAKKAKAASGDGLGAEGGGEASESYEPTGEIVADSGFRPDPDGFSFPNYGAEAGAQDLTPANVENLFGAQVCVSGSGEDCVLTPAGQKWMDTENENMGGGHCMGFSVAALRMYAETLDVTEFGAETTHALPLQDNNDLQATLAESYVYQSLDSVLEQQFTGTPTEVVTKLVELLEAGDDTYTLGFYKADGTGGHAMTPLAVEDKGDGQMAILVYDNNYPDSVQAMEVDTNEDTYRYIGAVNPDVEPDVYEGDATTQPMELIPTTPGEAQQPCPFCDDATAEAGGEDKGSVLGAGRRYTELSLAGGRLDDHPHLLLTTEDGKQAGIVDGELKEEIPGVQVIQQWADDPSEGTPEPKFRIPFGTDVNVTIDGSELKKTAKDVNVNFTGDGKVISAEDFEVAPGQVDQLFLPGGDTIGLVYETQAADGVAPTFFAGVDEKEASYTLGATALNLKKGSQLAFFILQKEGQVLFDASDAKGKGGEAQVITTIGKLDESGEEQVWLDDDLVLDTDAKEDVYLNYKEQQLTSGKPIDLEVGPEDGPFRKEAADFQKP